jgi:thiamine kinase-like enzyme
MVPTDIYPTEPHGKYITELNHLASSNDPIKLKLSDVGRNWGWWPTETSWFRAYSRFPTGLFPYVVFVYESHGDPQHLCLIEISKEKPPVATENVLVLQDAVLGWLKVGEFPSDPHLPTLQKVLAASANARVVRYRPHWRCTLRLEDDTGIHYLKVFRQDDGNVEELHNAGIDILNAASRGELDFDVAKPQRWDRDLNAIWQGNVLGSPAAPELYAERGPEMARRMGFACASIPRANLRPSNILDLAWHLNATEAYAKIIRDRIPDLEDTVEEFFQEVVVIHRDISDRALLPIHGSPHPSQWLISGSRLGLVDFDRFSLGDPELDVATFMAEVDFMKSTLIPTGTLNQAFVEGYEARYGQLDPARLRLYRAHKRFAKVQRTACSLNPDAPSRAVRHMALAWEALKQ